MTDVGANGWRESLRGMVFPMHCDHLNHVNNRWYAHFFDDAMKAFWSLSGLTESAFVERYGVTAMQVKTVIEYRHSLVRGDQFLVQRAFARIGNKSVTFEGHLHNAATDVLCATYEGVTVFVDADSGKSTRIPDEIRANIEGRLVCDAL